MAASVFLKPTGQGFRTSITEGPLERVLSFGVRGAVNVEDAEVAVLAAIGSTIPAVFGALPLAEYQLDEEDAEGVFNGRAVYKIPTGGGGAVGESRLSFNTSGGVQHISQSLELMAVYGESSPGDSGYTTGIGQPVGATADAVEGADIPVAIFEWETTVTFDDADVDDAYVAVIEELTGTVNGSTFKGRDAGEVLFLGASGQQINEGPWDIAFRFATSKNKSGMTIGSITGIVKNGWELLDPKYQRTTIGVDEFMRVVQTPFLVLIHRVFEDGDFADLDLP